MTRTFEPALDRILVRPKVETESKGGIMLPKITREDMKKKRSQQLPTQFGEVLAVGPGPRLETGKHCPLEIKVGDTVAWCCAIELAINFSDEELVVIDENSLLGVVREAVQAEFKTSKLAYRTNGGREIKTVCPYCNQEQVVSDDIKSKQRVLHMCVACSMKFIVG